VNEEKDINFTLRSTRIKSYIKVDVGWLALTVHPFLELFITDPPLPFGQNLKLKS
jgi:hypothetical protein